MGNFASKLIELRKNKGYSQEDLARKLYVSRQSVSKWENGKSLPSVDLLHKISAIFEVSIDTLLDSKKLNELTIENNNSMKKQNKKNRIIAIVLTIAVGLSIIGVTMGVLVINLVNKDGAEEEQDVFLGVLIDINTQYRIRDNETVTLEQLEKECNPYFILRTAIEEGADLSVSRTHSYSFAGGSVYWGSLQEYKNGYFYYDASKIDKNAVAYYYYIMESKSGRIYITLQANIHINSLPNSTVSLSNKSIQITPKKINSVTKLEILSFNSDNIKIDSAVILESQNSFTVVDNTSYIEIKTYYIDKNGITRTVSERRSTKELAESPVYTRMITDSNGFLKNNTNLNFNLS